MCNIFCVLFSAFSKSTSFFFSFYCQDSLQLYLIYLICSTLCKLYHYKGKMCEMPNISTSVDFSLCFCVVVSSESSKLVVGRVGETVTLPCKYDINAYGPLNICWGRHQSLFSCENTVISSDGLQVNYRESHRFSLASGLDRGDVSLTIRAAQKRDAGMYVCRIEIPGLFNDISYNVYLFISNGE